MNETLYTFHARKKNNEQRACAWISARQNEKKKQKKTVIEAHALSLVRDAQ
jgi:hypothetical protein